MVSDETASRLRWIGVALAAGAAAHFAAVGAEWLYHTAGRPLVAGLWESVAALDDLAPGRLAHGQGQAVEDRPARGG